MKIIETNLEFKSLLNRSSTKKIIIHHAAATAADAKTIHKWHINRGWSGIGYHFVVLKNGSIERGRPVKTIGAHCTGENSDSIGICFEGNFEKEKMPDKQIKAGRELLSYLYEKYGLNKSHVKKHKDLMATSCPGKNFPYAKIINGKQTTPAASGTSVKSNSTKTTCTTASNNTVYTKTQFIKDVQSAIGAKTDGIAGPETLSKTITVSMYKNNKHNVVKSIQKYLNVQGYDCGTVDGIAGIKFDSAIKAYQKAKGCIIDGELTAKADTWRSLLGLR
ncbi:MAG: N-acetylmuramoyl-L-alanine amidase [Lachnospiraceae bacterium]|nr:N-acetylmuramoyl-L-alanine amidase [Lachnospiraceae bacterium]